MNIPSRTLLFWTPRVVCIAFALFLSLFSLDVFGQHFGIWKTLLALLIHLAPAFIVLAVLAVAWRWEWAGAAAFAALAAWYAMGNWRRHADWVLVIAVPLLAISVLFLINWLKHDEFRTKS